MANNKTSSKQQGFQNDPFVGSDDDAAMIVNLDDAEETTSSGRGQQGFASMTKEKQREIASKGGKAAHAQGTAHEWNSKEAAEAGRRGGQSRSSSSDNE